MRNILLFIYLGVYPTLLHGLVDYTAPTTSKKNRFDKLKRPPPKIFRPKNEGVRPKKQKVSRPRDTDPLLELSTDYRVQKVDKKESAKVNILEMNGKAKITNNMYLNLRFWQAHSSAKTISQAKKLQSGNPEIKLGFHWLKVGDSVDYTQFDFFGSLSIGTKTSSFGHSRNDTSLGLLTFRKFNDFSLILKGAIRLTGNPKVTDHMAIGNITTFAGGLFWDASLDIKIGLEAATYQISAASDKDFSNRLKEDISFSVVTPKIILGLGPSINLYLATLIPTKKIKSNEDIVSARIYDLHGAYGSYILFGMNFSV